MPTHDTRTILFGNVTYRHRTLWEFAEHEHAEALAIVVGHVSDLLAEYVFATTEEEQIRIMLGMLSHIFTTGQTRRFLTLTLWPDGEAYTTDTAKAHAETITNCRDSYERVCGAIGFGLRSFIS